MRRQVFPQAPSPTMTNLRRISAICATVNDPSKQRVTSRPVAVCRMALQKVVVGSVGGVDLSLKGGSCREGVEGSVAGRRRRSLDLPRSCSRAVFARTTLQHSPQRNQCVWPA